MPQIIKLMPKLVCWEAVCKKFEFDYDLDILFDDYMRAYHGLSDIHNHYDIDTADIGKKGYIPSAYTKGIFRSYFFRPYVRKFCDNYFL